MASGMCIKYFECIHPHTHAYLDSFSVLLVRAQNYLLVHDELTSGSTTEENSTSSPAAINCQLLLREGQRAHKPLPYMIDIVICLY